MFWNYLPSFFYNGLLLIVELKYRSRTDIICSVLATAREVEGVAKTRIMFSAYLSFSQLKDYLGILLENGMLERVPQTNKYRTTDKGIKMLDAYSRVNQFITEGRK
jgi:predicted transcriptional regulator